LIRETTIENKNAAQNPDTEKPGTIASANKIKSALITRENNPKVIIVIGKVRIKITGLINILIIAITTAKIIAPNNVTVTPGIKYAAINIAIVDVIQCIIFILFILIYDYIKY
jgi:hypothetical protein